MTDEQLVRGAWNIVGKHGNERLLIHANRQSQTTWFDNESALAAFTRGRIEQIRQVREEIAWMKQLVYPAEPDCVPPVVFRILQRLEAAEANLLTGMNREFVDEYLNIKLCEDEGCPHYGTPHVCIEKGVK